MVITEDMMLMAMSSNGGYTLKQLRMFGIHDGYYKGWKKDLIGTDIDEGLFNAIVSIRNEHLERRISKAERLMDKMKYR